jgi:hypothetical protein
MHIARVSSRLRRRAATPSGSRFYAKEKDPIPRFLPALLAGVGAGAFHALIRLAYTVLSGDDADVAPSLAYLEDASLPLGPFEGDAPDVPLAEFLAPLRALASLERRGGLIYDAMTVASQHPTFALARRRLPRAPSIADLAALALRMHRAAIRDGKGDFTTLHAITAVHALRIVAPLLANDADRESASRHLVVALAAAYVTIGAPDLTLAAPAADAPPWTAIVPRAIASTDEHVVKLVFTAREEEAVHRDPAYRAIAAHKAQS